MYIQELHFLSQETPSDTRPSTVKGARALSFLCPGLLGILGSDGRERSHLEETALESPTLSADAIARLSRTTY